MTGDSWMTDIGRPVMAATHWSAALYFISEYLVTALVRPPLLPTESLAPLVAALVTQCPSPPST